MQTPVTLLERLLLHLPTAVEVHQSYSLDRTSPNFPLFHGFVIARKFFQAITFFIIFLLKSAFGQVSLAWYRHLESKPFILTLVKLTIVTHLKYNRAYVIS